MENGYIKMWRKTLSSAVFANPVLFKLWALCLMKASYKERIVAVEGSDVPITLAPGQFVTGRFSLHKEFYPTKKNENKSPITLWRSLKNLEKLGNVNIKSYSKYSVITIQNWEEYQDLNNRRTTAEQQLNNRRTTDDHKQEGKEGKEGREVKDYVETVEKKQSGQCIPYKKIIDYLNEKIGGEFKATASVTKRHIKARWSDGFRENDFLFVIDEKADEWMGNVDMEQYVRPQTLFGTKFESYLVQAKKNGSTGTRHKEWVKQPWEIEKEERAKNEINKNRPYPV